MTDPSAQTMLELADKIEQGTFLDEVFNHGPAIAAAIRSAYTAAPAEVREAVIEECAKVADQVAINAQRRGAGYPGGSPAQEAAYNKMEGATDVAHAIRDRTSQVTRPHPPTPEV